MITARCCIARGSFSMKAWARSPQFRSIGVVGDEQLCADLACTLKIAVVYSVLQLKLSDICPPVESANFLAIVVRDQEAVRRGLEELCQFLVIEIMQVAAVSVQACSCVVRWVEKNENIIARLQNHVFEAQIGDLRSGQSIRHGSQ